MLSAVTCVRGGIEYSVSNYGYTCTCENKNMAAPMASLTRRALIKALIGGGTAAVLGVGCWFTEGFDMRDLKEAKALLDEL